MVRMIKISYFFVLLGALILCKPPELSNACDPKSESFFNASIVRFLISDSSPSCLPGFPKTPIPIWGAHSEIQSNVEIKAMALQDNKLYLGGTFQFLGPNTGGAAILNTTNGSLIDSAICPYLEVLSNSNIAISDEQGGFYLAGNFTHIQGIAKQNLVHINSNCKLDTGFDVGTGSGGADIRDLLLVGEKIYIAGSFSTWNGLARGFLAAVNRTSGTLDTTWIANADGTVESIIADTDGIFVAGQFLNINGSGIGRLSKISYETGSPNLSFSPNISAGAIRTIAMGRDASNNKVIYAGGSFTAVSPTYARSFEMDGNVTSWNPAPNGLVDDLTILGSKIYLIGSFNLLGSTTRNHFAAVDNNFGAVGGEDLQLLGSDSIASITEFGGKIYVLGNFSSVLGKPRRHGFSIDPVSAIFSDWNPNFSSSFSYPNGRIAFSPDGSKVLVPGYFTSVNVAERNGFGSIDLITGKATDINLQLNGSINSLHIKNNILYAGGSFTSVLSQTRTNFFAFNLNSFSLEGMSPTFDSPINHIATDNNYIYAGGSFFNVAGSSRSNLARLQITNGILDSWNPGADNTVSVILPMEDKVYVGGIFTTIGGSGSTSFLSALNLTTGNNLLFPSSSVTPNGVVKSIAHYQNQFYIGGDFITIGAQTNTRFSSFDGTTGVYTNQLITTDNTISTISIGENGKGFIGGSFTTINGSPKPGLVFYDFLNKNVLNINIPSEGNVSQSFVSRNTIYFGGKITQVNNRPKGGFYFWDL
ncbi:hypothetical protein EHQ68_06080 [Leptospira congkakensis]|uniref:Uncharacterized protein n=2 Tax=Leptospira congkakensis TaxID=2484932 RepID=A0A8B5N5T9_9LEPT|nr:hypothetical protein EHQ69_13840 [Leptospira congkakensis]TGL91985.1 hypothetical protein EHQ68_06080 [Leptospira congkakensis]